METVVNERFLYDPVQVEKMIREHPFVQLSECTCPERLDILHEKASIELLYCLNPKLITFKVNADVSITINGNSTGYICSEEPAYRFATICGVVISIIE